MVPGGSCFSPNLREYAGLKDNVVFVGQGDYFEIWSVEQWQLSKPRSMTLS